MLTLPPHKKEWNNEPKYIRSDDCPSSPEKKPSKTKWPFSPIHEENNYMMKWKLRKRMGSFWMLCNIVLCVIYARYKKVGRMDSIAYVFDFIFAKCMYHMPFYFKMSLSHGLLKVWFIRLDLVFYLTMFNITDTHT